MPHKDIEAYKACQRAWYKRNKERVKKNVKNWRAENREHYRALCRKQYDKNPAKARARFRN